MDNHKPFFTMFYTVLQERIHIKTFSTCLRTKPSKRDENDENHSKKIGRKLSTTISKDSIHLIIKEKDITTISTEINFSLPNISTLHNDLNVYSTKSNTHEPTHVLRKTNPWIRQQHLSTYTRIHTRTYTHVLTH